MPEIDTLNKFAVGMGGMGQDRIRVLLVSKIMQGLDRDDAFNLAAYLVVMGSMLPGETKFEDVRKAIENT